MNPKNGEDTAGSSGVSETVPVDDQVVGFGDETMVMLLTRTTLLACSDFFATVRSFGGKRTVEQAVLVLLDVLVVVWCCFTTTTAASSCIVLVLGGGRTAGALVVSLPP